MKEKFEHKLVNKIKDVFDSHQSDINPQDWELMKENLPDKKSRFVPLFWTITKVASVLLFIAFGSYFLWNGLNNEDSRIIDNESIVNTIPVPEEETNNIQSQTIDSSNYIIQEYLAKESDINQSTYDEDPEINERTHHPSGQIAELSNTVTDQPSDINIADGNFKDTLLIQIPESTDNITNTVPLKNDSVFETNNETKQTTIAQLEIPPDFIENEPRQRQKARIGVEFATFANYSPENITPSMNYGGGLAAHIPIKKRFSFNPGLIVSVYDMAFSEQTDLNRHADLYIFKY